MGAVLTALGTMAAVVAAGWLLGRRGTLGDRAPAVLARVVFAVATPCLLLVTVAHSDLHLLLSRAALVTAISTGIVALAASTVLRWVWHRPADDVVIGTLASSYVNAGNLGLPLAVYLLGSPVAIVPPLLFQLLVLAPIAFTVLDRPSQPREGTGTPAAGLPDSRASTTRRSVTGGAVVVRTLSNPIIVGALTGLVLAAVPWHLPDVVFEPFRLLGAAAAPMALLTFGLSLAVPRSTGEQAPRSDLVLVVLLRSAVHPALAAAIGSALGLSGQSLLAVVAISALPTAQNVLVYALQYRRGQALARDAGLVTTILAVPVLLVITALLG
jgi:malonate transporter